LDADAGGIKIISVVTANRAPGFAMTLGILVLGIPAQR